MIDQDTIMSYRDTVLDAVYPLIFYTPKNILIFL